MKTIEEVLEIFEARIDRQTLENYITHEWLRPVSHSSGWYFEEIDIARIELVCHLVRDIKVNDEGMDVVLSLLDQLYGIRAKMHSLTHAVTCQSTQVQTDIIAIVNAWEAQGKSS